MPNKFRLFRSSRQPVVRLQPKGPSRGVVSLSYQTWPFRDGWDSSKARGHTNAYEVVVMAECFRDQNFIVEVVDYTNTAYVPPPNCRVAIDIHSNLHHWHALLPPDCLRILHATGSHWLLWNSSEFLRLQAVRERKAMALVPRRQVEPSNAAMIADHIVVLGNRYTVDSFSFTGRPCTRVPISSAYEWSWPEGRDFETARRKFLWVGSYGMVHKGLDLVLDAFAGLPGLELTVCGRPEKEEDFFHLYHRELKQTSNIHFKGWMDMATTEFREIASSHASAIYPSCAEGGAGSVIHCMHAGLIPVCTAEASVDLGDFGEAIESGSVESVRAAARRMAACPPGEIAARARRAWEHARARHTRSEFRKNYGDFAAGIASNIP